MKMMMPIDGEDGNLDGVVDDNNMMLMMIHGELH